MTASMICAGLFTMLLIGIVADIAIDYRRARKAITTERTNNAR